jgi:hypothetical protein
MNDTGAFLVGERKTMTDSVGDAAPSAARPVCAAGRAPGEDTWTSTLRPPGAPEASERKFRLLCSIDAPEGPPDVGPET